MSERVQVGETVAEVMRIYRAHAGVLLPIAFWIFLVIAILEALAGDSVGLAIAGFAVGIFAATLYQGIVVGLVRDMKAGRSEFAMGELVRAALPFALPLAGAGLLLALGIAGGFLLFIVPGLYLLSIWAVVAPSIVIERRGVFDAFGRSRQLVRGNGWPVLGAVLTALLLSLLAAVFFTALAEELAGGPLLRIVFTALAATAVAPIEALVAAVLYFRLVSIAGPPPAPAAAGAPEPPGP